MCRAEHADSGCELVAGAAEAAFGSAGGTGDRADNGRRLELPLACNPRYADIPHEARVTLAAVTLTGQAPAVAQLLGAGLGGTERCNATFGTEQERRRAVTRVLLAARLVGSADERGATVHGDDRGREPDGGEAVTERRGQLERQDVAHEPGQLGEGLDAAALVVGRRGGGKDQHVRRCAGGDEQWQRGLGGERHRVLVSSR